MTLKPNRLRALSSKVSSMLSSIISAMPAPWTCAYILISLFWLGLILYGLIPAIIYARALVLFPEDNHIARFWITVVLAIKSLFTFLCIFYGGTYCLLELPRTFVVISFTFLLRFRVSSCMDVFPHRYRMICGLAESIALYWCILLGIIFVFPFLLACNVSLRRILALFSRCRDIILLIFLLVFIVLLLIEFRAHSETGEMVREEIWAYRSGRGVQGVIDVCSGRDHL
jgi:hypothetical protein